MQLEEISTHTPLTGRDTASDNNSLLDIISTHTPLTGRDPSELDLVLKIILFLLTRPLRDVTVWFDGFAIKPLFLLTRPLRDVTRTPSVFVLTHCHFYSHAPYGT